jgi:dihydrofolate reductase
MISIVVAMSKNRVIGIDNKLPWHLPEDLKRFKNLTTNNVVVMGRKTHLSIGKPLPKRLNVILTRNTKWHNPLGDNCVVCYSVEEVLERFKYRDLFIIGGSEVYKEFLNIANRIYLTVIDKDFTGDAFFPDLPDDWRVSNIDKRTDEQFDYTFLELFRD